ncbi:10338_t:CDS:2 [Acaulospora morrowiae]|uniref:Uracil-DNA glycosylase n=1 Tax=Acaulospora morrowiae TaxID=94023 RepID=A0A9N9AX00_9GLOM|nr:10338_t:CDS:2 [Acaulospora morrowiae]
MSKRENASSENTTENNKKQKLSNTKQSSLAAWIKTPTVKPQDVQNTVAKISKGVGLEANELLKLEFETLNSEWLRALADEIQKPYFIGLKKFLQEEKSNNKRIFPPENEIYSWSRFTPPSSVKIVILGQDPYHGVGQAHGLCFSVPKGVQPPPSLVNIYKALQKDIPSFQIPNHGYLANWAKSGVLLLNTSLTVRAHEAASHSGRGWEKFTDAVIQHLNEKKTGIVFMLWGSHAIKKGKVINKNKHLVLDAVHPSPLSAHRGFFDSETVDLLESKAEIKDTFAEDKLKTEGILSEIKDTFEEAKLKTEGTLAETKDILVELKNAS